MGLLDSLFAQSTYGGQGGGLLDFLRQSQMQQEQYQPSAGFPQGQASPLDNAQWPWGNVGAPDPSTYAAGPIAVGNNYQMPRTGNAAQFTPQQPDPAALPPNAQPTQGTLPQGPQSAQEPGFGDRLMAGFQNFANAGGPLQALAGGVQGLATGNTQANQTARFLESKGIDPAIAKSIVSDPQLLRAVLPQVMGMGGQTDDIKEYQFAKKENPSLTFEKFMQQKKAVSGEYSLTPQFGTDEKGNTIMIQTGKSGTAIQTVLPPGVKLSSGVDKIDLGTTWGIIDKKTGQMVGQQAKDVAGKASQEVQGEAQGKAVVALPTVISTTEQSLKLVDEMIKHPGRGTATGLSGTLDPRNYVGGTDAKDFQIRAKQIEGRTFLSAFDQLRGAGAITEAEGQKATAAVARLDRAQSDDEYLKALNELKQVLNKGMEIAKQRAGQGGQTIVPAAQGRPDLKSKYGLD